MNDQKNTPQNTQGPFLIISLFILALGVGFAGLQIYKGLTEFRSYDKFVTVKGLATRDVTADLAVWPIGHTVTGDDLSLAQDLLEARNAAIIGFLKQQGLEADTIRKQQIQITDLLAQSYRNQPVQNNRFILKQTIMVRTADIEAISKAAENIGQLIKKEIVLTQGGNPTYLFTRLNDVKPDMIAEATKSARAAAAQFAQDSGQDVGSIRRAYQGMFQILPRDQTYAIPENQQKLKTVRVVSTVDFYLE